MPTAAKLVSAVLFAVVAYAAAEAYAQTLPPGQPRQLLVPIVTVLGLFQGWLTMGGRVGAGISMAITTGVRTSFQIAFWAIVGFGLYEMFYRSTRLRYDGPGEAVIAAIELFMEYGLSVLMATTCLIILFVGGALAGILAELVNRRWS
ncbi:TrgA family protein [Nioella sp.]|uniref:TrgA family protein n=1 Tax=Nioella sp. TaxID=1912091 RepID=UPI0035176171